jgi:hypothetical protein
VETNTELTPPLPRPGASWLNQRVSMSDPNATGGTRYGWVIHVGQDRGLLVLWDDDEKASLVTADNLIESQPLT